MALAEQVVPVKFGRLDQKTNPRHVVIGDLVALTNVDLSAFPELRKRAAFGGNGALAAAASGSLLALRDAQVLVGTGAEAYGLTAAGTFIDSGILESCSLSVRTVVPGSPATSPLQAPDVAVHPAGITVVTYTLSGKAYYSIFDTARGQTIVAGVLINSDAHAVHPKPLVLGNYVVIVYGETNAPNLSALAILATSPTATPTIVSLATDAANQPALFDAAVIGGTLFFAYADGAGKIALNTLSAALIAGAEVQGPTTAIGCLTIFGDTSNNVWLAYYSTTSSAIQCVAYNAALSAQIFAPVTVDATPGSTPRNICGIAQSLPATIFYEVGVNPGSAGTLNNLIRTANVSGSGTPSGVSVYARGLGLASKPFYYLSRVHVLGTYDSVVTSQAPYVIPQRTYFLLSGSGTGTVVGKLAPGTGSGLAPWSQLPEAANPSAGAFVLAYLNATQTVLQQASTTPQYTFTGALATFDFTKPQVAAQLSGDLHVSGGILSMWDGAAVCEHGFHLYPENLQFSAGGSGAISGTYQACVTYEWTDAQGLLHMSAPSPPVSLVAASAAYFNFTVAALRLTSKPAPIATPPGSTVSVIFWRTQANQTVFYRVGSVANGAGVDTISYPSNTDTATDTQLGGMSQLVFNPDNSSAELPPLAAPAPLAVWRYKDRLAIVPAEAPTQWQFSKEFVPGVPVEFNADLLYQQAPEALTCGIEQDQFNVLFSATGIWQTAGNGPASNGTSSDYPIPQNIPSPVGCTNPRSLIRTPLGVFFQASIQGSTNQGIWLLGRDLSVQYIGAPVEPYNAQSVVRAVLVKTPGQPSNPRVIFFMSGGVALAYDLVQNKWIVYPGQSAADACVYNGLATYIQPGGAIFQETPGAFADFGNAAVLIGLTTSILSFAGISGAQRVWRCMLRGSYKSPHLLTVSILYDDAATPAQTWTVDAGALFGGGSLSAYEVLVKLKQQRCTAIQLQIQESQVGNATFGEGLSLSGLAFLVGIQKGLHRVAQAQSITAPTAPPSGPRPGGLDEGFDTGLG
jgi:hypothetical protein